jgi:hypothetical protein
MMLNFQLVREETMTMDQLVDDLTREDLGRLTGEMVDAVLALIADCTDADVIVQPMDPQASDPWAASAAEASIAWTLGHVMVHITASAEESATLAAELARGVKYHGRSRYEVPWEQMRTIAGCRQRLQESRRMQLASLEMWPDPPHLDNRYKAFGRVIINPIERFAWGLYHEDDHLGQIADIVRQAHEHRGPAPDA